MNVPGAITRSDALPGVVSGRALVQEQVIELGDDELAAIAGGLAALRRAFRQAEEQHTQDQGTREGAGGARSC